LKIPIGSTGNDDHKEPPMLELLRYFPAAILEITCELESQI
jgi:hypothetical protein